ncbi:MAG: NADPH:quinone oxidoreductase family protein [Rubrivivax sp.]
MQAWRVEQITDPPTLVRREIEVPAPAPDQYLVKVEAAGVAFGDTLIVRGKYQVKPPLPFTPGSDVVGRIVGGERDGLRVASSTARQGGFAEYVPVPRGEVVAIGDQTPAGAALALRSNFPTSLYALRHAAKLQRGETLLVHAAAGGVGSAALLLGQRIGARVIATAGGPEKAQLCRELGADAVVDYRAGDWVDAVRALAPDGVDVIYDPVGGDTGAQSLRVLAFGARYLVVGFAGGTLTQLPANRLLLHNASAVGVLWGEVRKRDPALSAALTAEIYDAFRDGALRPPPGRGYAFDELPQALAALEGRSTVGKVWIEMPAG